MKKVWKNQKGITLVSLMVYLIGLIAIIGIVAVLTSFYSKNVATMNDTSEVNSEFNKFDAKMIQETSASAATAAVLIFDIIVIQASFSLALPITQLKRSPI